jgi:hypothetical protein
MNTDNPQETVSSADVGWLTGIIEGEGSISLTTSIRSQRKYNTLRVTPKVIITNTDNRLIEKCLRVLGEMGIGKWVKHKQAPPISSSLENWTPRKSFKDVVVIEVTGMKRTNSLFAQIIPHMAGDKRERAALLLEFTSVRISRTVGQRRGANVRYSEEECEMILRFFRMTRTKSLERYIGILNDYTRGTSQAA